MERLETLNFEQMEINEQRNLLSADEQNELTAINLLEDIANDLMATVGELEKQLNAGEIEDEDGAVESTLDDLRTRLSTVLAEQAL